MFSTYGSILRYQRAWQFSAAGLILRLPMSMVGISIILLVRAEYGSYALAGAVSATNIIVMAVCAPLLARLVDRYGQLRIMGPAWAVSTVAMAILLAAAVVHAPQWTLFIPAAIAGATWGAPGALVRSRWTKILHKPGQLSTAYAYESAIDELIYILGPVLSTVLGTMLHRGTGLFLSIIFLSVGGVLFLSKRDSEPAPIAYDPTVKRESVIAKPAVLVMALTYIGMGMTFGANDVSIVAFTEERGMPALSGVLLAVFSFGSLMAALYYGARSWKRPLWQLFAIGVVAMALGTSTYLLAFDMWSLAAVILLTGMTCAPTMTNVNMIVQKTVSAAQLTEGLTWMSTSLNLGVSLGTAVAGPAIDMGGSRGGFYTMVGAVWIMVILMLAGLGTLRRATKGSYHLPEAEDE